MAEASRALDAGGRGRMLGRNVDVRALSLREALREMSALRDLVEEPFPVDDGIEFDADEFASVALDAE